MNNSPKEEEQQIIQDIPNPNAPTNEEDLKKQELTQKLSDKDYKDYLPQIHNIEQGYIVETKLNCTPRIDNEKINTNESIIKSPSSAAAQENKEKIEESKEKLISNSPHLPQKKEEVSPSNKRILNIKAEAEPLSPSIDGGSPTSDELRRKKSILKGSPNFFEKKRNDAEGHNISPNDKKHRISFRSDLYQIKEVESFKKYNDDEDSLKKCCKFCNIQ